MTNEQVLGQLSKREVAFRVKTDCLSCVFWARMNTDTSNAESRRRKRYAARGSRNG